MLEHPLLLNNAACVIERCSHLMKRELVEKVLPHQGAKETSPVFLPVIIGLIAMDMQEAEAERKESPKAMKESPEVEVVFH